MFKHLNALFIGLALFACTSGAVAQTIKPIETPVPVRPAGQKDVVGLTTPKLAWYVSDSLVWVCVVRVQ